MASTYPGGGWVRLSTETLDALQSHKAREGHHSFDATRRRAAGGRVMLDELVTTLLWEGYALYPYTPGATKNATPTPFGIVYPPAYAQGSPTTFDRIRMQGIVGRPGGRDAGAGRARSCRGAPRSGACTLPPTPLAAARDRRRRHRVRVRRRRRAAFGMAAQRFDERLARVTMCVHNTTPIADGRRSRGGARFEPALHARRRAGRGRDGSSRRSTRPSTARRR